MINRVQKTAVMLGDYGARALLVLQPENRYYLSGFTGSFGALLVTRDKSWFITDFRYLEQAREQTPHLEIIAMSDNLTDTLKGLVQDLALDTLAFEAHHVNYKLYATLAQKLTGVRLLPVENVIEKQRQCKENGELAAIARSMSLLDEGFDFICGLVQPGISEAELSLELELYLRRRGATATAFPFIIASGPRSALPHGTATGRVLAPGDVLTMDFGVILDHYNSDMTRTVALGRPPGELQKIYQVVLEAQLAGLAAVKAGVKASAVDAAARSVIESGGYGRYFGHSTGHGVGLAVHELPRLSPKDHTVLQEGMVVTVEPGIYIPGLGGVRIEDSVVVEKDGCRVLTSSFKDRLLEL